MIIDAHAHIGGVHPNGDENTVERLITLMDEYDIDKALLFPILPLPLASPDALDIAKTKSFRNDLVFSAVKRFPDRFFGIYCVHPGKEEEVSLIDEKIGDGSVVGLKIHPYLHGFKPQSSVPEIVVEKCAENNVPLYIHSGPGASPIEIGELVARYPEVNFIIGHMGECVEHVFECIVVASQYANVFFETSCLIPVCVKAGISIIGIDRFIFGSECPTGSHYSIELPKYDLIGLNEEEKDLIFYKNTMNLFNL